MVIRLTQVR